MTDAEQKLGQLTDKLTANLKKIGELEGAKAKAEAAEQGVSELKSKIEGYIEDNATLSDQLESVKTELHERQDEFEAKQKQRNGREAKSAGAYFAESYKEAGFNSDMRGSRVEAEFEAKAITDLAASGGDLIVPDYRSIIQPAQRQLRIRDLISVGSTSSNSVVYMKETVGSRTDNAQTQAAQGDLKGQSDFVFDKVSEDVITVAHFVKIARQMLDDVSYLRSYVDTQMRYMLEKEEEDQILGGSGTGELNGIKTQATAYDTSIDADASALQKADVIRFAMLQVSLANHAPDGIVLNPADWASIELLKDSQNGYLFANPQNSAAPRLWGLPVVSTTAQTDDEFTVGDWRRGAQLFQRENARVMISTEDQDDFVKNMATILAELREALAVYYPTAFVDGDFSLAISGA